MIHNYYFTGLVFLSGLCFYSAVQHYTVEKPESQSRVRLLFSVITFLLALSSLSIAISSQAITVEGHIPWVRVNTALNIVIYALLPWFFAEYSGVRPMPVLAGSTAVCILLFFINLINPYTMLYSEIHGLNRLMLPWREEVFIMKATAGIWAGIATFYIFFTWIFVLYLLVRRFQRDQRSTTLVMIFAFAVSIAASTQTLLVRAWGISNLPPLGAFGFLGMVIIMGITLNRELREDRRRALEELRQSESRMNAILSSMEDVILEIDLTGCFEGYHAPKTRRLYVQPDYFLGKKFSEVLPADVSGMLQQAINTICAGKAYEQFEYHLTIDNTIQWVHVVVTPRYNNSNVIIGVAAVCRDITELKRAEEALRESEALRRAVFESSRIPVIVMDKLTHRFLDCNPAAVTIYGFGSREETLGRTPMDVSASVQYDGTPSAEAAMKYIEQAVQDGSVVFEWRHRRPDGTEWDAEVHLLSFEAGGVALLQFSLVDITERKHAEDALAKSEIHYRTLFDQNRDAVMTIEPPSWRFTSGNQAIVKMFGVNDIKHLKNLDPKDVSPEYQPDGQLSSEKILEMIEKAMREGSNYFEWKHMRLDGTEFYATVLLSRLDVSGKSYLQAVVRDITELKLAEESLKTKVEEIERFNRLAVNRELRIRELKRQLAPGAQEPEDTVPSISGQPSQSVPQEISDLLDRQQMQALFDSYCDAIGIASAIIDLNGEVFVAARWQRLCTEFHRRHPAACARCIDSDTVLASKLKTGEAYTIYTCKNGLTDAASPIIINGHHIANVFVGQFLLAPPDYDFFRRQAAEYSFDETAYIEAVSQVPVIDETRIPAILRFMVNCANIVALMGIERIQLYNKTEELHRQQLAALSLAEDATDARQMAEAARQMLSMSQERLQLATRAAGIGIWDWDIVNNVLIWDDDMYRLYGIPREYFGGAYQAWRSCLHPEDRERAETEIQAALSGESEYATEFRVVWPDGSVHYLSSASQTFRDDQGKPVRMIGTNIDITGRKRAEEEIKERNREFTDLVEAAPYGIAIHRNGIIRYVNPAVIRIIRYRNFEEAIGEKLLDRVHPDSRGTVIERMRQQALDSHMLPMVEEKLLRKDGEICYADVTTVVGTYLGEKSIFAFFNDITERKLAEERQAKLTEQLHQSQKMDAIGQLAGGVAHDFNNLLAGIMGSAQLLQFAENLSEKQKKYVSMILSAAERAGSLTKKLLTFSRSGNKASTAVDCVKIIKDTVEILHHTIDKSITITLENRAVHASIIGDDSMLMNVFMNMGINASHAMPSGGTLTFTLENLNLDKSYCEASPFDIKPGNFIGISVRDTGCGMAPEIISRIFEPFFTTKEQGKGTGLGLSMVYGTVQDHGGAITVYSEPGEGTVFHIYFPVDETSAGSVKVQETLLEGTGTVLLIDDEELIRLTAEGFLESLGYSVLSEANGEDGVKTFIEKRSGINLIILDMIMPVMGGREALIKLREIDRDIPIIISSGFAKEENMGPIKEMGISGFLQKPFRIAELAEKVHNALKK